MRRTALWTLVLTLLVAPTARAEQEKEDVSDAARVLSRIVEKKLRGEKVKVNSFRWVYLNGRGLLLLGGVELLTLRPTVQTGSPSGEDLV